MLIRCTSVQLYTPLLSNIQRKTAYSLETVSFLLRIHIFTIHQIKSMTDSFYLSEMPLSLFQKDISICTFDVLQNWLFRTDISVLTI